MPSRSSTSKTLSKSLDGQLLLKIWWNVTTGEPWREQAGGTKKSRAKHQHDNRAVDGFHIRLSRRPEMGRCAVSWQQTPRVSAAQQKDLEQSRSEERVGEKGCWAAPSTSSTRLFSHGAKPAFSTPFTGPATPFAFSDWSFWAATSRGLLTHSTPSFVADRGCVKPGLPPILRTSIHWRKSRTGRSSRSSRGSPTPRVRLLPPRGTLPHIALLICFALRVLFRICHIRSRDVFL